MMFRLSLGLVFFLIAFQLVDTFALSSIAKINVDMESDHDSIATIYFSSSLKRTDFLERRKSHPLLLQANIRKTQSFELESKVVRAIRLDPGNKPGIYRIYSIAPLSYFGKTQPIEPFLPEIAIEAGPGTSIAKKDGYLEIVATTDDPYIIFNHPIRIDNPVFLFAVPFLTALLILAAIEGFSLTSCIFWTDTIKKIPSGGLNYNALDGLRGLAALLVLATHTGLPGCDSVGHVGVIVFFCLSGFLLTLPYAKDSSMIFSLDHVRGYYLRRLKRIAPMFYFILIVSYLFNDRTDVFVRSVLFLQGNSILWTVLQEVHFYIFLPVILFINHLILRGNKALIVGLLLVLGYCFNHNMLSTYTVYGIGHNMKIHAGLFFCGIAVCYLCRIEWIRNSLVLRRFLANPVVGLALLATTIGIEQLWALSHDGQIRKSYWLLSGNFTYLVGALIALVVLAPDSLPGKLFSTFPLRLFGTVSYSFYLLHPMCLTVVKSSALDYFGHPFGAALNFVFTLLLTFILSTITYTYIEKPFLKGKSLDRPREVQQETDLPRQFEAIKN
jgi:peptidoglycan/LPS O-acetylase OafA/YrhL